MDEEGYLECTGWEKGINTYVCLNDRNHSYTEEIKVPLAIVTDEPEDGIYKIDGSNITIDLGKKLERYNEAYGYQSSLVEAFGDQTIREYIYSLSVYPYNDELKQWWIATESLDEKQIALYAFIGDGIGKFLFENENDADTVIKDILKTGETVTYNVNYVPNNEAVFEKLEITVTFILPVIGSVIIG